MLGIYLFGNRHGNIRNRENFRGHSGVSIHQYYIFEHLWLLAIPIVLSFFLNVFLIELYHKIRRKYSEQTIPSKEIL